MGKHFKDDKKNENAYQGKISNHYRNREEKNKGQGKKRCKIFIKIIVVILMIFAVLAGIATCFVVDKLGKIQKENIDETAIGISNETEKALSEYRNIALLGIDSRADDYGLGNRSDCIIIASINQKTKNIKLISVYRDTYMQIEESGSERLDKVTHAYSYGGAQNTLKALNTNLDLNISEYVTVNFDAVIAAVNAMGGVNIDIDSSELKYINDYIDATSQSSGVKSSHITKTGMQTLDGVQAVAYSRIRYTAGGDYKRTERMRTVVTAMMKKAKTLSITKLNSLADTILPKISTNISSMEIVSLIPSIASFNITESLGWPYETQGITLDRWYGVPITLESNVLKLHQEAFGQEDYEVSDTVKTISNQIIKKTGYNN